MTTTDLPSVPAHRRRTRILATLGPATDAPGVLDADEQAPRSLEDVPELLAGQAQQLEGALRITSSDWFGSHVLAPVLAEYARQDHVHVDWDAHAWYGQVRYQFEGFAWKPNLTYRRARFSGDDPATARQERAAPRARAAAVPPGRTDLPTRPRGRRRLRWSSGPRAPASRWRPSASG